MLVMVDKGFIVYRKDFNFPDMTSPLGWVVIPCISLSSEISNHKTYRDHHLGRGTYPKKLGIN